VVRPQHQQHTSSLTLCSGWLGGMQAPMDRLQGASWP
jgi:hypothetical protein